MKSGTLLRKRVLPYKSSKKSLIGGWSWFEACSAANSLRKAWLDAPAVLKHVTEQMQFVGGWTAQEGVGGIADTQVNLFTRGTLEQ